MSTSQVTTPEELTDQNSTLTKQVLLLQGQVTELQEQLRWFQRQMFGKRSERVVKDLAEDTYFPGFKELFNEQTSEKEEYTVPEHKRKKRRDKATIFL